MKDDNTMLASTYRTTATVYRNSAEMLFDGFQQRGEIMPGNIRAVPFYYLISHAIELLIKCALLKRTYSSKDLKKFDYRHNLSRLLDAVSDLRLPISERTRLIIDKLSSQHEKRNLRYTALLDDGEATFTPEPVDLFSTYDELLMLGRIATYGR